MKLPNLEKITIEKCKITDYLLSEKNSGGKSTFFIACGFTLANWGDLRDALRQHATDHDVKSVLKTMHGTKYIIEATLQMPNGYISQIRSIWIIDDGKELPRLVTAYPLQRKD